MDRLLVDIVTIVLTLVALFSGVLFLIRGLRVGVPRWIVLLGFLVDGVRNRVDRNSDRARHTKWSEAWDKRADRWDQLERMVDLPFAVFVSCLLGVAVLSKDWLSATGYVGCFIVFHAISRIGRIHMPSSSTLHTISETLFSKRTYLHVFQPILQDLEAEHLEALAEDRPWKARWVVIRGHWSFWSAFVAQLPFSLIKRIVELWKAAG